MWSKQRWPLQAGGSGFEGGMWGVTFSLKCRHWLPPPAPICDLELCIVWGHVSPQCQKHRYHLHCQGPSGSCSLAAAPSTAGPTCPTISGLLRPVPCLPDPKALGTQQVQVGSSLQVQSEKLTQTTSSFRLVFTLLLLRPFLAQE